MNFLATYRAVVAGLALLISPAGWAADSEKTSPDPAKPAPDGHRFLFVIETSADNRKSEDANRQAVFDLIVGGVHGQMRTGDTFGLWTFSDEVRAGEFPMTVYASERALEIAGQVATFLQSRKYAKRPDHKPLIKQLRALADSVSDFNVFIFSSGQHHMKGTPFDQNINAAYDAFKKRPAKLARLPLVTSFVVRKGRPSGGSVVLAGERIDLPERPPAIAPGPTPATNAPPAANASNATNSSSPALAAISATTPTNPPPDLPKVFQIITHSNHLNPPVAATTNRPSSPPIRADATLASLQANATTNATPAPNTPDAAAPSESGTSIASPETLFATIDPTPNPGAGPNPTNHHAGYSVTPIKSILAAGANSTPESPLRVAAREPAPTHSTTPKKETSKSASTGIPVVTATTMLPPLAVGLSPAALLAIGGTLLGATCLLVILVLRRTPPPTRGSLISQSMRRE